MRFDFDLKTLYAFLLGLLTVVVQAVTDVYNGSGVAGIGGLAEWLGVAAIVFGPAGLVALVNNTPWSPSTKHIAAMVSTLIIVVVQGMQKVYDGGITGQEWLGIALLVLTTLGVYAVPAKTYSRGTPVVRR
jgi:hypothetical protein